jgi:hypothetical protein
MICQFGYFKDFKSRFVVDVLGFQIELCCRYFWPFLTWQSFGLFLKNLAIFRNLLVTLQVTLSIIFSHEKVLNFISVNGA